MGSFGLRFFARGGSHDVSSYATASFGKTIVSDEM